MKSALGIRLATSHDDVPALINLSREASKLSRFGDEKFKESNVVTFFDEALSHPKSNGIILAEGNGEVIGCLIATASRLLFADAIFAQSVFFFVRESSRASIAAIQLLKAYEIWARNRKAIEASIHITMDSDASPAVARFLKRKGYSSAGENMYCQLA